MKVAKVILVVAVIFMAGLITGRFSRQMTAPPPPPSSERPAANNEQERNHPTRYWAQQREHFLKKVDSHLDLSPEQKKEIEDILIRSQERMKDLWEPVAPLARDEYNRGKEEIRRVLSPEQEEKFEEIFDKHKGKEKGKDEHRDGGDGGPRCQAIDLPYPNWLTRS